MTEQNDPYSNASFSDSVHSNVNNFDDHPNYYSGVTAREPEIDRNIRRQFHAPKSYVGQSFSSAISNCRANDSVQVHHSSYNSSADIISGKQEVNSLTHLQNSGPSQFQSSYRPWTKRNRGARFNPYKASHKFRHFGVQSSHISGRLESDIKTYMKDAFANLTRDQRALEEKLDELISFNKKLMIKLERNAKMEVVQNCTVNGSNDTSVNSPSRSTTKSEVCQQSRSETSSSSVLDAIEEYNSDDSSSTVPIVNDTST